MAKRAPKASTSKRARAGRRAVSRVRSVEDALAAAMKREAKAASRLEAAQAEVAVLRLLLAELVAPPAAEAAATSGSHEAPDR